VKTLQILLQLLLLLVWLRSAYFFNVLGEIVVFIRKIGIGPRLQLFVCALELSFLLSSQLF
jgi:hypothetical protein